MSRFPTLVLPKGSKLFHGTLEDIEGGLLPGGYDKVLWFADIPAVAQLYIPRAGGSAYIGSDDIATPNQSPSVQAVQRAVGIEYDYDRVEWGPAGRAQSWVMAPGWEDMRERERRVEIEKRLHDMGYRGKGIEGHKVYRFYFTRDQLLPPDGLQQGTLCAATTRRDMTLWEKAIGEGDLTSVQYHDVPGFARARKEGLDGVVIDDFAQSEEWGNVGHLSVGLFREALEDLDIRCVPATYEELTWERGQGTKAWPKKSEPYFHTLLRKTNYVAVLANRLKEYR